MDPSVRTRACDGYCEWAAQVQAAVAGRRAVWYRLVCVHVVSALFAAAVGRDRLVIEGLTDWIKCDCVCDSRGKGHDSCSCKHRVEATVEAA